jgi:hypothetical protein
MMWSIVKESAEYRACVRQYAQPCWPRSATRRRSSAGLCLSDMVRAMDPELIHQRRQAHTTAFGKVDQYRHTVGMPFFSPSGQPGQFFVFNVGD